MNRRFLIIDILKITCGFALLCAIPVYLTAMASQRDNRFTLSLSDLSFAYILKKGELHYWDIPRVVSRELSFNKLDVHTYFLEQYQGQWHSLESLKDSLEKYAVKVNYLYIDPFKVQHPETTAGDPLLMYCYKWISIAHALDCGEVVLNFPESYLSTPKLKSHLKELFVHAEKNQLNLKIMATDTLLNTEGLQGMDENAKHYVSIAEKGRTPHLPKACGGNPCGKITLIAKTYAFHEESGYETTIDYQAFVEQLVQTRQPVNVSIEYCGTNFSGFEGLHKSRQLFLLLKQQYI